MPVTIKPILEPAFNPTDFAAAIAAAVTAATSNNNN